MSLCERMDPDRVVVYTASMPGDLEHDATLPFPVYRDPASMLLPTPAVARRVVEVMRRHGCDRVLFGASAPLGLLAPRLRRAGARRIVALTHGHEVWWAKVPVTRQLLRRIGDSVDVLTYVSDWCRSGSHPPCHRRGCPDAAAGAGRRHREVHPGLRGSGDAQAARAPARHPGGGVHGADGAAEGPGHAGPAWPAVLAEVPDARLVLVGEGPRRSHVEELAERLGVADSVIVTGGVPWEDLPAYFDAADVFAMPCRTRVFGLEVEAFGIVFLEAAACGVPVVVGRSGGAPETVVPGETGALVDPRDPGALAGVLVGLLSRADREELGAAGRRRVAELWEWDRVAERLAVLLEVEQV